MAETKWTEAQLRAIEEKPNILVNAAAGSGKTAVLVERIIRKLLPDENGKYIDADKLLVVTFARDAAAEMSQRVKDRLLKVMRTSTDAVVRGVCRKQIRLLPLADITTIDAFCIKTVRNNFHLLGIDPRFTVMDNIEAVMLRGEVLARMFDELYENDDEDFLRLAYTFGGTGDDAALEKLIMELYNFTRSLPDPEKWLLESADKYKNGIGRKEWTGYAVRRCGDAFNEITKKLSEAADIGRAYAEENGTNADCLFEELCTDGYWTTLCEEIAYFSTVDTDDYNSVYAACKHGIAKYRRGLGKGDFKFIRNDMTECRLAAAEALEKIKMFFDADDERLDVILDTVHETARDVASHCIKFSEALEKEKNERASYEFNDLEHMCLKLLREYPEVRAQYAENYAESMIDEYQDTNGLQEEIFNMLSNGTNRFMVGDMKQSIYRFRMSDPFIFRDKDLRYRNDGGGTVIDLNANFRSRPQVLDGVNAVFEQIMRPDTAEIDYNEAQRLNLGNVGYLRTDSDRYISELCIIEEAQTSENAPDKITLEARYIAQRIRKMIDEKFSVCDKNTGELRPCRPGDFAILASSVKSVSNQYIDELAAEGIAAATVGTGFFECPEIILALNFMKVINNPRQDIPLVCVLRSPVYRFGEDELAKIRCSGGGSFYDAMCIYAQKTGDEKCRSFIDTLEKWRVKSAYLGASELLWNVYTDTSMIDVAGAMENGDEAQVNLRVLFERARGFETSGYKGIFNFCTYIDKLRENGDDSAVSGTAPTVGDAVNIMTIHRSKGLEFPIVFLCSTGKKLNMDRTTGLGMRMHREYGLGMSFIKADKRTYSETLPQRVIADVQKREAVAEDIRKLYVALTRPREKLIVVGAVKAVEGESGAGIAEAYNNWRSDEWSRSNRILSASTYLDLIAPAVIRNADSEKPVWKCVEVVPEENEETDVEAVTEERRTEEAVYDEALYTAVDKILSREYPYTGHIRTKSRMYVTEVQRLADGGWDEMEELRKRPSFSGGAVTTGAAVGTAYHALLSEIQICADMSAEYILLEIKRLTELGIIEEAAGRNIIPERVAEFFTSELGRELCGAEVRRESPFEILVNAADVYPDGGEGQLLLQGIIDCWFIRSDGSICLIDYKSDRVDDISKLAERYGVQLRWYKKALEKMTGRKVSGVYIYSLYLSENILVE